MSQKLIAVLALGVVGASGSALLVSGCGKKDAGATGGVKFANSTTVAWYRSLQDLFIAPAYAAAAAKPAYYGIKLLRVELRTATMSGNGSGVIYLNPQCAGLDTMHCGIDAAAPTKVTTFFDFAQSTADVNTALNAQQLAITPDTYVSVALAFTRSPLPGEDNNVIQADTAANVNWKEFSGDTASTSKYANGAIVTTFDSPVVIAAGDTVTVNLGYSLDGLVTDITNVGVGAKCADGNDPNAAGRCMGVPTFAPTIVR